jgi:arylsulfatase A-like enzyme
MYIKRILIAGLVILGSSLISSCSVDKKETTQSNERPNILFIFSDDHSTAAISAYGGIYKEIAPTPNIDKIAEEGILFNNMYSVNAICGPSRAAILTGKHSHINGFYKNESGGDFDNSQQTFPKLLQAGGYQTAIIGKWHLGSLPTGFDYFKVMINHGGQGTYFDAKYVDSNGDTIKATKYSTYEIADDALNWLDKNRDKNKPFMLMCQFKAPHRPWDPAPEYANLWADVDMPVPATFNDTWEGKPAAQENWMRIDKNLNPRDLKMKPPRENMTKKELRKYYKLGNQNEYWSPSDTLTGQALKNWKFQGYIKDYLRVVRGVDDQIGRLLKYLDDSKLADNTIVIYSSDQGFFIGEHGMFDKRFMYEESTKMPFVMRYPNHLKKGINKNIISEIDIAPTLLDFAGIEIPNDIQGKSFVNIAEGKDNKWRDSYYYHYYEYPWWHHIQPHYGIRTNRYKLIHFYYSMDVWELYDLEKDPDELNNIYGKEGYEAITKDLKKQLKDLQKEYKMDKSLEELRAMTDARIHRVYGNQEVEIKEKKRK